MRILLVHNSFRTFVRYDRDILAAENDVDAMDLSKPWRIVTLPWRLIRSDLIFIWFASLHSIFPAILGAALRKPIVAVVGAYDAANIPEINFGHMGHPIKKYVVRAICNISTLLVCNSEYARQQVEQNVRPRTPIRVVAHGVEFPPLGAATREPIVVTIGQIRKVNLARKGHEVFVRAAALVPEAQFVIAGEIMDNSVHYLRSIAPENAEVLDYLSRADLNDLYGRASVYVQASVHESFGLTVVEAMAAGDIPVVSRRGSLPDVAGPNAIFVDESDPESVAQGIRIALRAASNDRHSVSALARERFPMEKRRSALLDIVRSLKAR